MEFLKKNYEKVLLGVVLLGLTVAVALLLIILPSKRAKLVEIRDNLLHPKINPLPLLDLAAEQAMLERVQAPVHLDFTHNHNLFNPVVWQKKADGSLIKVQTGHELGPDAMQVTAITPLYLQLTFDDPSANGYLIGVENEAAVKPSQRPKRETFVKQDTKNDMFTLRQIKGPPEKPEGLLLEMNETGETVFVGPGKPYKRVEGYSADLKYPPESNKMWRGQRIGAPLTFGGGQYNIVAITQTNVVILFKPNEKKTTINFNVVTETR
ncbi:MAG: hypothetical protein JWR19_2229 [Pedosphaera sp.]|nr:hypothetical protein [Pedosphaera sp.]